jgi:acetyl-CoA C-acetyltransferase
MSDKRFSYVVGARRSPIGRFLGGLSRLTAVQIGAQVARRLLDDGRFDRSAIDDVLIGMVLQAGAGQNPARQIALAAGCPDTVSACVINKVCGSGLQSVMFADQLIRLGDAELILAGGIESMSQAPFLVREMRGGQKFGNVSLVDSLQFDGLVNIYDDALMGDLAEETAARSGATRAQQDEFAARSHQRAARAIADGRFRDEIVPIEVRPGKEPVATDECVRPEVTAEALAALKPAFKSGGTITAGNASTLADGAALVLVAGEAALRRHGLSPLARIVAHVTTGAAPRELFYTPVSAIQRLCEKAGWRTQDVDLWDITEAFAAEMVVVLSTLGLDPEKVNVHGGSIAMGHPLGASGTRVLVTLLHAMRQRTARRGVVAMCLGGGNAVAMAVEAVQDGSGGAPVTIR